MALPFTAYLDKQLMVLHTNQSCPGLHFPSKYKYMGILLVSTVEQARELDREYKACDACKNVHAKAGSGASPVKKMYRKRRTDGS